jgi:SAM-dependent methyltransferase
VSPLAGEALTQMVIESRAMRHSSRDYWDGAAEIANIESSMWRVQSDVINTDLIDRWLRDPVGTILKTDLFDETVADGLHPALRARARRVVGVDVSPVVVSSASARYPDMQCVVGDVRRLPFDNGSFDAVISNSTLDHLKDRDEVAGALVELRRVVRPGGRLLLTLDNAVNPVIAIRDALPARVARAVRGVPYDSGWTCGPRTLRRLLLGAGFELKELTAVLHLPRGLVAKFGDRRIASKARWDSLIRAGERLERLPTRYLTGHFVAALAVRP